MVEKIKDVLLLSVLVFLGWSINGLKNDINAIEQAIEEGAPTTIDPASLQSYVDSAVVAQQQQLKEQRIQQALAPYANATDEIMPVNIYGNPDAPVTLIEFANTQCSYCKKYHYVPRSLVDNSKGRINIEYRYKPLANFGAVAGHQAIASQCVAKVAGNRHFWAYLDIVYAKNPSSPQEFIDIAQSLGVNVKALNECTTNNSVADKLSRDSASSFQYSVTSTPTTVVRNNINEDARVLRGLQTDTSLIQSIKSVLGR